MFLYYPTLCMCILFSPLSDMVSCIICPYGHDTHAVYNYRGHFWFPCKCEIITVDFLYIVLQFKTVLVTLIADVLWVCAMSSYIYSTFLGYSGIMILTLFIVLFHHCHIVIVMGRLRYTVYLLSPVLPLLAMCVVSIPFGWNYTNWFVMYYKARAGV